MDETHMSSSEHYKTKNARGYMHPLSEMGKKFIQFAQATSPVMDMGCAYGNLVIAALEAGVKEVIACDMEASHLDILRKQLKDHQRQQVTLIQGYLPEKFTFKDNSMGAIHTSHILEYLNDKEIDQALELFYRWLKPGGKLFIKCYSIYIKELINPYFQTEYEKRLDHNVRWPGYLVNYLTYLGPLNEDEDEDSPFPPDLHMFDLPILTKALVELGFELEFADYMDGRLNGATQEALYDGREYIGIIACKPSLKLSK